MNERIRKLLFASILLVLMLFSLGIQLASAAELESAWQYRESDEAAWHDYEYPMRPPLSSEAQVVYLRTLIKSQDPLKDSLFFTTTNQAVKVYLDTVCIYESGTQSGMAFDSGTMLHRIKLPDFRGKKELIIVCYGNRNSPHLGVLHTLRVDTELEQIKELFFNDTLFMLTIPIAPVIFLLSLVGFRMYSTRKNNLYVYISLFMLVFVVWGIAASGVKILFYDNPQFWWYVLAVLAYFLPITANLILYELLRDKSYAHMEWVIRANILLFVCAFLGEIAGYHSMNRFMKLFYPMLLLGDGLAIYWCMRAAKEGDELCQKVLVPAGVFLVCGLMDGFSWQYLLFHKEKYLTPLGLYAFVYFVIYILKYQLKQERILAARNLSLEQEALMAEQKAQTDVLTGCWNRVRMQGLLSTMIQQSQEKKRGFSVLLLDLDHFKRINDTFGHDVGDEVLRTFADTVRGQLECDQPCIRWGGEEFMVVLHTDNRHAVSWVAEKIHRAVALTPMADQSITCSIGIAHWHGEGDSLEALFKRVDLALYHAKNTGRNRICWETEATQ